MLAWWQALIVVTLLVYIGIPATDWWRKQLRRSSWW